MIVGYEKTYIINDSAAASWIWMLIFNPGAAKSSVSSVPEPQTAQEFEEAEQEELVFTADGMVLEGASNPGVKVDDEGVVTLLFEDRGIGVNGHDLAKATASSDWLSFTITDDNADIALFHTTKLPDGTYRSYQTDTMISADTTKGTNRDEHANGIISESSTDDVNFTPDNGYRYLLEDEDNGTIGVWNFFIDDLGGVILLYIGDKFGENNVRRAYSTDNGWTFAFDRGNVLGDENDGQLGIYVDQNILSLGNGVWKLITMRQGSIYLFESIDDGYSFRLEGKVLGPEDFPDYNLGTLNDPKLAQLPDGRLRICVTGMENTGDMNDPNASQNIFSATTQK